MQRTTLRSVLFLGLVSMILSSCSSYLPYPLEYPMRTEPFLSRGHLFTGRVPQGWFYASEDTLVPELAAWVVREDFAAALAVRELQLDMVSVRRVQKEGLNLLASISLAFQTTGKKNAEVDLPPKTFSIRNRNYSGYEFTDGAIHKRVVVFTVGGRYYECVAAPTKGTWDMEETKKLFTAQQAFLTSLTF